MPEQSEECLGGGRGGYKASAWLPLRKETRLLPSGSSEFSAGERTKNTKRKRWNWKQGPKCTDIAREGLREDSQWKLKAVHPMSEEWPVDNSIISQVGFCGPPVFHMMLLGPQKEKWKRKRKERKEKRKEKERKGRKRTLAMFWIWKLWLKFN